MKDEYAVVRKASPPQPGQGPEPNDLYARVDMSKKTSHPSRPAHSGATADDSASPAPLPSSQSQVGAKNKPKKEAKPTKPKKDKGKERKGKKGVVCFYWF